MSPALSDGRFFRGSQLSERYGDKYCTTNYNVNVIFFFCRFYTLQSMLKSSQASFVLSASRQCLQKQLRTMSQSIYDFTAVNLKGEEVSLSKYKGKVVLIENVASL